MHVLFIFYSFEEASSRIPGWLRMCYVLHAGLELVIFLPQPLKGCVYGEMPPFLSMLILYLPFPGGDMVSPCWPECLEVAGFISALLFVAVIKFPDTKATWWREDLHCLWFHVMCVTGRKSQWQEFDTGSHVTSVGKTREERVHMYTCLFACI